MRLRLLGDWLLVAASMLLLPVALTIGIAERLVGSDALVGQLLARPFCLAVDRLNLDRAILRLGRKS